MADPSTSEIVIPSTLDQVTPVQDRLIREVRQAGFDQSVEFGMRLALDEALTNAIRHGNALDPAKQVTVTYQITSERFEVRICDEGPGFHLQCVADPTLDENLARPEGRGVLLMKAYMSEVYYNQAGNCVTLIRNRQDTRPQASSQ